MVLITISYHGKGGKRGPGVKPPENIRIDTLSIIGKRSFLYREDTKKDAFVHLLKMAGV